MAPGASLAVEFNSVESGARIEVSGCLNYNGSLGINVTQTLSDGNHAFDVIKYNQSCAFSEIADVTVNYDQSNKCAYVSNISQYGGAGTLTVAFDIGNTFCINSATLAYFDIAHVAVAALVAAFTHALRV